MVIPLREIAVNKYTRYNRFQEITFFYKNEANRVIKCKIFGEVWFLCSVPIPNLIGATNELGGTNIMKGECNNK